MRASFPGLGQRLKSTGTRDLKEALKNVKLIEAGIYRQTPDYRPTKVKDAARLWFDDKAKMVGRPKGWRESTKKTVENILNNHILPAFGELALKDMTATAWKTYCARFYAENPGRKLFNTRKTLVAIMKFARDKGFVTVSHEYLLHDDAQREGIVIPQEDFEAIFQVSRPHFRVILAMYYYMGMRKNEVLKLARDRVDLQSKAITLRAEDVKTGSKTGRGRDIGIAPEVFFLLKDHLESHDSRWVFPAGRGSSGPMRDCHTTWDRMLKRLGLPAYHVNDLRHTFLDRKILTERRDPLSVAIYAGTSLEVIQRTYLHSKLEKTRHVVDLGQTRTQVH